MIALLSALSGLSAAILGWRSARRLVKAGRCGSYWAPSVTKNDRLVIFASALALGASALICYEHGQPGVFLGLLFWTAGLGIIGMTIGAIQARRDENAYADEEHTAMLAVVQAHKEAFDLYPGTDLDFSKKREIGVETARATWTAAHTAARKRLFAR